MPAGWDDPTRFVADLELDSNVKGGFAADDVCYEVGFSHGSLSVIKSRALGALRRQTDRRAWP